MPLTNCPSIGTHIRVTRLRGSAPGVYKNYIGDTGVVTYVSKDGYYLTAIFTTSKQDHNCEDLAERSLTLYVGEIDLVSPSWWDIWAEGGEIFRK